MTPPFTTDEADPTGKDVRIIRCEARVHGDNAGCLCDLIGGVERIARLYETPFVGTPTYWLLGRDRRVRLSECTLVEMEDGRC